MRLAQDRYTYRISWAPEEHQYVGLCIEFPDLKWFDHSPDDALNGIRHLVQDTVARDMASGKSVPGPMALKKYSGKFMVRIPPEVHRNLSIKAAEEGVSLNRLISSMLSK